MKIKTDSPVVKKAREGVMEFLLVSKSRSPAIHMAFAASSREISKVLSSL